MRERALEQARASAGAEIVTVMGGASIGQQYIAGGLVDEIRIHLVPVLFGSGTRMFEHLRDQHIQFEPIEVIDRDGHSHAVPHRELTTGTSRLAALALAPSPHDAVADMRHMRRAEEIDRLEFDVGQAGVVEQRHTAEDDRH